MTASSAPAPESPAAGAPVIDSHQHFWDLSAHDQPWLRSAPELAPLLRRLPAGRTPLQIAQSWSNLMPLDSGLAIAGWLVNHGVLVGPNQRGASSW